MLGPVLPAKRLLLEIVSGGKDATATVAPHLQRLPPGAQLRTATLLLAQGVDARTIMETLGHSQMSLTMNTYAHVMPALQREAAAKMDAILTR